MNFTHQHLISPKTNPIQSVTFILYMRKEVLSHVKPHPPAHSVTAAAQRDEIKGTPHIVSSWMSG